METKNKNIEGVLINSKTPANNRIYCEIREHCKNFAKNKSNRIAKKFVNMKNIKNNTIVFKSNFKLLVKYIAAQTIIEIATTRQSPNAFKYEIVIPSTLFNIKLIYQTIFSFAVESFNVSDTA